jgi:hypothetical protein
MASGLGPEKSLLKKDMCLWVGKRGRLDDATTEVLYVLGKVVVEVLITNLDVEE